MPAPETRPSLILRLRNHQDIQSWTEFAQIYEPLVFRLAVKMGMQHADALEAQQEVMLHLTKVVENWEPTESGSFRGWLYRVARNVMLRHLDVQNRQPRGAGGSGVQAALAAEVASDEPSEVYDIEFQRQVFAWAAARVQADVNTATWSAFWETFVEQQPVDQVAKRLGISRGNVYVSRSRVMQRIRQTVQRHGEDLV